jgi:hypothetical protein
VVGNLVFAEKPIFGLITRQRGNLEGKPPDAASYLRTSSPTLGRKRYRL